MKNQCNFDHNLNLLFPIKILKNLLILFFTLIFKFYFKIIIINLKYIYKSIITLFLINPIKIFNTKVGCF